ncbi:MAG: response regulator transcription factor [Elusimicrobia bacterium]|nr:response regulator transcription factor [Elusimicrobiota bacterium]
MKNIINVLIADDHAILRSGLKMLLHSAGGIQVAGEAGTGREAVESFKRLSPDIVVLDISLPDMGGLEAAREIKKLDPAAKILVLTMHNNANYVREFVQIGVAGYIVKKSADSELINAIRAIGRGDMFIDPSLTKALLMEAPARGRNPLSHREEEVLRLLVKGYLGKEVAARLEISVKTVETYRARIAEKLGISGRAELLQYAIKNGLFSAEPE